MSIARLDADDFRRGYVVCGCEKYAYIFSSNVIAALPYGYSGELCPECKLWVSAIDKLEPVTV